MEIALLHICNDFAGTKVHKHLYAELDKLGARQIIYNPLRNKANRGKNAFAFTNKASAIIYSAMLKKYHRVLFRTKINFLYRSLLQQIGDLSGIHLQHATTLFSDGAVAYKIYKQFGIPYVVTLRNTDINQFLLYRPDLYLLGLAILRNARSVFFISKALKDRFYQNAFFSKYEQEFAGKTSVINNGIANFWLDNLRLPKNTNSQNFIYVGAFDRNKNVSALISALEIVRESNPDITLDLVGGGGNHNDAVLKQANGKNWIRFHGKIEEQETLLNLYRSADYFVMSSIFETFGLVYIEALSQGLPIGYTKGQGIDGAFEPPVGVSFNARDVNDIKRRIKELLNNREVYQNNIRSVDFSKFRWNSIAKQYFSIYSNLIQRAK